MVDRQIGHVLRIELRDRRQRHLLPRHRRLHVELVERVRITLQLRRHLQDHVIRVELREVLRHLPLPERVVQRVIDLLRLNAEARRLIAIDHDRELGAAVLLIRVHVPQLG